jgi:sigma-B regulation protein RsbU (phosphoserine phosphatase)
VAHEVGGDFLVYLPWKGRAGIGIGDVCGKGVPAALISTSIGHLLPWLRPMEDPPRALRDLNEDLLARIPPDTFVSMVLADIDLESWSVQLWTAGHPPALLWKAARGQVQQAEVHNQILGILPEFHCEREDWHLEAGDVLLLYTDGLTEVRSPAGEQFDLERVTAVLSAHAGDAAGAVAEALLAAARSWGELADDLTLLVCKRPPESRETRDARRE